MWGSWYKAKANVGSRGLKPKYIIGVDASLRNVAISVFDNLGQLQASTCIKTITGWSDHQSIDYIIEHFFEFVNPYLVHNAEGKSLTTFYIEHILFGQNGKSTARAEAIGIIKWNLRQERHSMFGVVPTAANSFIAGKFSITFPNTGRRKRNSEGKVIGDGMTKAQRTKRIKKLTMDALHVNCNFYTTDDNIADSYVMGLFGLAHCIEKRQLSVTPLYKIL